MRDSASGLSQVEKLVSRVVGIAHTAPHPTRPSSEGQQDVQRILNEDYGRHLGVQFSPQEMRAVVKVMRLSLPHLNLEQFRTENLDQLDRTASRLGARLIARGLRGKGGLELLGFYLDERQRSRKPTIYINSAHHPVAIAAAFWHEVGHHLTARFVSDQREPINLSLNAAYHKHLEQPLELLADMVVALAAYPKRKARQLFGPLLESGADGATFCDDVFHRSKQHLQVETGFEFNEELPVAQNLHYLAGMLHFAKLRMALLSEYDV